MKGTKKYIKMASCILGILLMITIFAITSEKLLKNTYADNPTKTGTASNVIYEFEAEDVDTKKGYARNIRVKSRTNDSKKLSFPREIKVDNITYTVVSIGKEGELATGEITDWTEIVIPKSVTLINAGAFKGLTELKTLSFQYTENGEKLIIGNEAFSGCTALAKIRNNTVDHTYTCSNGCTPVSATEHAPDCGEKDGKTITVAGTYTYRLPKRTEIIGNSAFYGCTSLTQLNVYTGVTTIGDYAFYNCTKLDNLTLEASVTTLGENTFRGDIVEETNENNEKEMVDKKAPLTTLMIKGNIENHNGAFKGHTGIQTLTFKGKTCTTIYDSMFEGCTGITKLVQRTPVTDDKGNTSKKSYITSIGARAFFGCTGLGGHGVNSIDDNGKKVQHIVHHIDYSLNKELKVGKDAYRFGGYAEGVTDLPTIDIEQAVEKADTEYYTNGIGKVTMNISSTEVQKKNPKDYIVCIDTTVSMDNKTNVLKPKKDKDGKDVLDKDGNVVMVKRNKMEIAVEALQLLANKIYEENPENRLAIVTQKGHSYLFMDFMDANGNIEIEENGSKKTITKKELVDKLISGMSTASKGNKQYGNSKAYYASYALPENNCIGTNYKTGLLAMAEVIAERTQGKDRNVYGIFISDGYPNRATGDIKGSAAQLEGFCDAIWSVSIALEKDDGDKDDTTSDEEIEAPDQEYEEEVIDDKDLARYLKYIRTYWGNDPLYYGFPDSGELETSFKEFMSSIVDVSTSSLKNIKFRSKLNTDIWEFYTGKDYTNSEGFEIEDEQYAKFEISQIGTEPKEYYYYIRLKDNKRDVTDPKLLVSNDLSAAYTITGGRYNGWVFDKEKGWVFDENNQDEEYIKQNKNHGVKAIYDTPLYLDWSVDGTPPDPGPVPPDPGPGDGDGKLYPGKLEIVKTGEGITSVETKPDGTISPIYGDVKVKGAEFEVYAKEDIYVKVNKENIAAQADETDPGNTGTPENPGDTGAPENPGDTGAPENPGDTGVPENPGDTGAPENPGDTGAPENPGDTGAPENPGDTGAPEQPVEQETKLLYAKDTLIKRITTDEYGKAQLESLPAGKYYVKEVKAGEGFILNEEIKDFEIVDQGEDKTIQKVEVSYKNERQTVDIIGKEGLIVEKVAEKKVYKPGEEIIYTIRVTNTTKYSIKEIYVTETMIEGKFEDISTDNILKTADKSVAIKELKPGESVELKFIANIATPADKEKIVNHVEATGKVQEPDPEDPNKTIPKDIKGEDEEEIYIATKELVIVKEALRQEYYIGETVQYVIKVINNSNSDITNVEVEEKMLDGKFVQTEEASRNGSKVTLVNDQKVTIDKIEPGKMVTLKYEYTISKDTKVTVDGEEKVILANHVTVKGKIQEPDPNDPDKTIPKDIEDEDKEEIEIIIKKDEDESGIGSGLGIIKKDLETGKTIPGAVIGLYAKEDIQSNEGKTLIAKDTLIEKATTNEQGRAKYTVNIPLGKYYIKEIEAPAGYKLSTEQVDIDATYKGQDVDKINISAILTNIKDAADFSVDKTLSSISMNGKNVSIADNKLTKLEIKSADLKKTEIIVKYNIRVTNKSSVSGTAKVLEIIPQGYEVVEAPEYWKERQEGILETEVNLEGKESKDLQITLKWINTEENLGSRSNTAKLETDGDGNTNKDDDNSQATIIVNVKTGEIVSAIIIIMIVASLGICGYIISSTITKMGKGPDIRGIKFLKK